MSEPRITEHTDSHVFPPMQHGGSVQIGITVAAGDQVQEQFVMVPVQPNNGERLIVRTITRVVALPPPAPPETDHERRARLVREQLDRARQAGILGLTTNDATVTVNAILEALNGEFIDEDMSDLNPNDNDPRDSEQ